MSDTNDTITQPVASGASTQEDRTLALLTHLSGIVLSFIVPLVIWLTHKDKPAKSFLVGQGRLVELAYLHGERR